MAYHFTAQTLLTSPFLLSSLFRVSEKIRRRERERDVHTTKKRKREGAIYQPTKREKKRHPHANITS